MFLIVSAATITSESLKKDCAWSSVVLRTYLYLRSEMYITKCILRWIAGRSGGSFTYVPVMKIFTQSCEACPQIWRCEKSEMPWMTKTAEVNRLHDRYYECHSCSAFTDRVLLFQQCQLWGVCIPGPHNGCCASVCGHVCCLSVLVRGSILQNSTLWDFRVCIDWHYFRCNFCMPIEISFLLHIRTCHRKHFHFPCNQEWHSAPHPMLSLLQKTNEGFLQHNEHSFWRKPVWFALFESSLFFLPFFPNVFYIFFLLCRTNLD